MIEALYIQVKGIVQGVGFRPFVYRMAKRHLVSGWVLNAADGVFIHAEAEAKLLDEFVLELSENPPVASRVEEIALKEVPLEGFNSFEIRFSDAGAVEKTTLVSPDLATCDDCSQELFNPNDRRFRYPFINCTNCGPRFTIIQKLPYDRKNTSMQRFSLCKRCAVEYADPLDRRFHAQPDACFECGPHISWCEHQDAHIEAPLTTISWGTTREQSDRILARAVEFLRTGKILAVKGLGGFHLVCDASNQHAVQMLRARKRREGKAFAVMMSDVSQVRRRCCVSDVEASTLSCVQRPIVLLRKRPGVSLAPGLADTLPELGVMLPCTPLQQMLLHDFSLGSDIGMLVMTSGNLHDEPIVTEDEEAFRKLSDLADGFIGHNRAIHARYDDSVVRIIRAGSTGEAVQFIRRARGYAPLPLALPSKPPQAEVADCTDKAPGVSAGLSVFATGPEQKNTFTLTREGEAFTSQHMGDMESAETYDAWLTAKKGYEALFEIAPTLIVCDMHPEYLTSKWAHNQHLPVKEVQHHHAHIASVMGEHNLTDAVCGIAFDGTGFGVDGTLWGGEVLLSSMTAFERFANFAYIPLPGAAAAIKHPLRMAYAVLWAFDLLDHPAAESTLVALGQQASLCHQMIEQGINTPMTSSVGRLFDAASALLGVCLDATYEGEPAILLEATLWGVEGCVSFADRAAADERYVIDIVKNTATAGSTAQDTSVLLLDAAPTFKALLDDKAAGVPLSIIAQRFHDAFVQSLLNVAELVRSLYGIQTVALSGGVFMNRYLVEHALSALEDAAFTVAINRDLPPNDGCVSFGQAVVACASNIKDAAEISS